jgi:hypothetical protein
MRVAPLRRACPGRVQRALASGNETRDPAQDSRSTISLETSTPCGVHIWSRLFARAPSWGARSARTRVRNPPLSRVALAEFVALSRRPHPPHRKSGTIAIKPLAPHDFAVPEHAAPRAFVGHPSASNPDGAQASSGTVDRRCRPGHARTLLRPYGRCSYPDAPPSHTAPIQNPGSRRRGALSRLRVPSRERAARCCPGKKWVRGVRQRLLAKKPLTHFMTLHHLLALSHEGRGRHMRTCACGEPQSPAYPRTFARWLRSAVRAKMPIGS